MTKNALLVLGGARSGKSALAEKIANRSGLEKTYVATAQPTDAEMHERIRVHKARRDNSWASIEAPLDLVRTLRTGGSADKVMLIDCLTVWLSNQFMNGNDIDEECQQLSVAVPDVPGMTIFVSNEVGSGIVPDNALARRFRDAQGRLNQLMAETCGSVVLVVAGLPQVLKGELPK